MVFVEQTVSIAHGIETRIEGNFERGRLALSGVVVLQFYAARTLCDLVLMGQQQFGLHTIAIGLLARGQFLLQDLGLAFAALSLALQDLLDGCAHTAHCVAPFRAHVIVIDQHIERGRLTHTQARLFDVLLQRIGGKGDRRGCPAGRGKALDQLGTPLVVVVDFRQFANIPGQFFPALLALHSLQQRLALAQRAIDSLARE